MIFPYKICDPIHGFIRFQAIEGELIDSFAFQRLRYLHQMGIAYLLYPGATHCRFQHSLGVMELATRIFDTITKPINDPKLPYYRQILRLAALCHDLGHLPFSHTAEKALLPNGGHERQTLEVIQSQSLKQIWKKIPSNGSKNSVEEDILKFSIGEKSGLKLLPFEKLLAQVITDDNFGADRIDYLLRDAYYTGVGYGHFDYRQLIDTLRILPECTPDGKINNQILTIGVAASGIQSVESLWMARYLMYSRVYHHPKARIYTMHLERFITNYYKSIHFFPCPIETYLHQTDTQILQAIQEAAEDPMKRGHQDALALTNRKYTYKEINIENMQHLQPFLKDLEEKFKDKIFIDRFEEQEHHKDHDDKRNFSVLTDDEKIISSHQESFFLKEIPLGRKGLKIYADREIHEEILTFISILKKK